MKSALKFKTQFVSYKGTKNEARATKDEQRVVLSASSRKEDKED